MVARAERRGREVVTTNGNRVSLWVIKHSVIGTDGCTMLGI